MSPRIRRCAHFVPGANDKMLDKALTTNADALVLDLEDAVTPERKDDARQVVCGWLRDVPFGRQERVVRLNALDTPWCRADLEATMAHPPDAYLVPKLRGGDEVRLLDRMIDELERQHGHPAGSVKLLLLGTETPHGLLAIREMCCVPRVDALTWGAEDLSAALGSRRNRGADGRYLPVFEYARSMCLLAACAADVQPLDTVFTDVTDPEGLRADCDLAASMGFTGKISIHPSQIDPINEAFTPSPADIERARELLDQLAIEQAAGRMAFRFQGQMVDVPHFTQAARVLAMASVLGL